jgi:hypothetical protein
MDRIGMPWICEGSLFNKHVCLNREYYSETVGYSRTCALQLQLMCTCRRTRLTCYAKYTPDTAAKHMQDRINNHPVRLPHKQPRHALNMRRI